MSNRGLPPSSFRTEAAFADDDDACSLSGKNAIQSRPCPKGFVIGAETGHDVIHVLASIRPHKNIKAPRCHPLRYASYHDNGNNHQWKVAQDHLRAKAS